MVSVMTESGVSRNSLIGHGGRDRDRTCDAYHVNEPDPDPSEPIGSKSNA